MSVQRWIIRLGQGLIALAILAACNDGPLAPTTKRMSSTPASKNLRLPIDWWNCASWDGGDTWSCVYDHTTFSGGTIDFWDVNKIYWTTISDCKVRALYCDGAFHGPSGGYPHAVVHPQATYDDATSQRPVPNCGQPTDDYDKAYCTGSRPTVNQTQLINNALN